MRNVHLDCRSRDTEDSASSDPWQTGQSSGIQAKNADYNNHFLKNKSDHSDSPQTLTSLPVVPQISLLSGPNARSETSPPSWNCTSSSQVLWAKMRAPSLPATPSSWAL